MQRSIAESFFPRLLFGLSHQFLASVLVRPLQTSRCPALPPLVQLLDFPLYIVILLLLLLFLAGSKHLHKGLQTLTGLSGGLFLRLRLLDGPDGILHLTVRVADNFLSLLMGLVQYFLLQLADAFQFLLVALGDALESLVSGLDAFQLFIQSLAVTGNLAEIALYVHILFPCPGFSILDYGLGHTHLAGQFKGERISREPGLKFEERGYILGIEKHCSVENPVIAGSIEFEIGIVGGNHAIDSPPVEFRKYGFSNSSSRRRFCPASELVNKHKCL